ncbi:MAG: HlyD family type I secretion periplasmic adaptor subunit [Methylobacteriaceae bacterium]|nr:HlyD family type I secretion periplasmic adaptor subunit [Methylobacteriaceae bacterium]MBV9244684.1 HlyD family type I secretion periplasmic adaptor subunit [Methylobacteriaceae bacterium]
MNCCARAAATHRSCACKEACTVPPEQTARILPWPRLPARRDDEREFLPAALEIIETPASPVGRTLATAIVAFFCVALAWSWFGHVDIIATAQGRLMPSGKVKLVQPLEAGIVRGIYVQDGDRVAAGDLLIELDATVTSAERDRVAHDLMSAKLDVARLAALKRGFESGEAADGFFAAPEGAPAPELAMARAAMQAQAAEQAAKLAALDREIDQKRAESEEVGANIDKLEATLPLLDEKERLRTRLLALEYGNRFAYLDARQQLLEAQHDLVMQRRRAVETDAARAALEGQRDQARQEYAHKVLADLAEAEQKASQLTQDLVKAERKAVETKLRAPISGVAQQLAVHTIGGVVTPAQQLMVIVPEGEALIAEATVSNRDVGFVHTGQEVEVKVETFNFTRYGLMHGHVVDISRDVVTADKREPDRGGEGAGDAKEDSAGGSPTYVARVALDGTSMMVDGRSEPLRPGMAVTAEIKTGSRRILDFLLSSLRQYGQEAIRER